MNVISIIETVAYIIVVGVSVNKLFESYRRLDLTFHKVVRHEALEQLGVYGTTLALSLFMLTLKYGGGLELLRFSVIPIGLFIWRVWKQSE